MLLTRRVPSAAAVVAFVAASAALLAIIAADARWLAALGREIVARGSVPNGVPYAAAPSSGWDNVPVLAELVFHGLESAFGDRGLQLAQVIAVAIAFTTLAWDATRAGADRALGPTLFLVAVGSFPALIAVRVQLFSIVLFPILLAFVRTQARRPSSAVWLLVPFFALWSNLHGAALAGLAAAAAYLVFDRARSEPLLAAGVLASSILALAGTPALGGTFHYYHSVLQNEAAQRGVGQWAPLSIHDPLDVLVIVVAVPLVALAVKARPRLWELVALLGLGVLTIQTARGGIWLLFAALAPAARAPTARWMPARAPAFVVGVLLVAAVAGIVKGPINVGASHSLVRRAIEASGGKPVLADDYASEQIALAGGRVLISNPLDAFRREEQRRYLDWLEGRPPGDVELERVNVVLVSRSSRAQRRLADKRAFRQVAADSKAVLYIRT